MSCSASGQGGLDVMRGDCECEDMTASIRDQKISEFLQSVFRSHAAEDGSLRYEDLAAVLASLGRRVPGERIRRIRAKFDRETVEFRAKLDLCLELFRALCDRDGTGLVDYTDPEFVLAVASLNVVDVAAIEDTVLASAFRTFDLVRVSLSSCLDISRCVPAPGPGRPHLPARDESPAQPLPAGGRAARAGECGDRPLHHGHPGAV